MVALQRTSNFGFVFCTLGVFKLLKTILNELFLFRNMATRVPKEPFNVNPEDLFENFLQKSFGELKYYLSSRGLSVTGEKRELIARAFSDV